MQRLAKLSSAEEILPLRTQYRVEMNCQIVKDSIHRRPGWTVSYLLELEEKAVGFGSVAIAGPWKDKPALIEFYVLPPYRNRAFDLFETLLSTAGPRFFEAQTNDTLFAILVYVYGRDIVTESIVFRDGGATTCPSKGSLLRLVTPKEELLSCIEERQGGGEWLLELNGKPVGKGGILFHYNRPYGDIYMEINEGFRKGGLGSFLVQELKQECYRLGAVPAARCNPGNVASRRTLLRAGFLPCAHILNGSLVAK